MYLHIIMTLFEVGEQCFGGRSFWIGLPVCVIENIIATFYFGGYFKSGLLSPPIAI